MGKKKTNIREIIDLKDMIKQSTELFGNCTAFKLKPNKEVNEYVEITYKQFDNEINCLGTALLDLGLKDETINVIGNNRYEWAVSYLAVVNGVGVVSPLDKSLKNDEIKSLVLRSKSKAFIFDGAYIETVKEIIAEGNTNVKYFICMDDIEEEGIIYYKDLVKKGQQILVKGNTDYADIEIDNEATKIILFTSGTTSQSKAVMLSHKNICSNIMDCRKILDVSEKDTILSFLPLHHTFECTAGFLLVIYSGATIAYCDGVKYLAKNINEYAISIMISVPILYENMYKKLMSTIKSSGKYETMQKAVSLFNALDAIGINTFSLRKKAFKDIYAKLSPNLRLFVAGAAAMDKEVVKGFNNLGVMFFQGYGLTETSPVLACESAKACRPGSVGKPLENCEVRIEDKNENGIGEIVVKAPYVMKGYYENPEATAEVLKDGWFYTGDLGYLDDDGYLYISGRKKTVIVLKNGKNIFPEELEALINELPYITESMVYGKPDKKDDYDICAKIVYDLNAFKEAFKEKDYDEKKIKKLIMKDIKKINKTLPAYKYVRDIIITTEPLIKTTTQKIKRHEELKLILNENK